jgi:hypothetical protein
MNIYYYLINLWPMLALLTVILAVDGIRKLLQKHRTSQ